MDGSPSVLRNSDVIEVVTHTEQNRLDGAGILAGALSRDPKGGVFGMGFCCCRGLEISAVGRRREWTEEEGEARRRDKPGGRSTQRRRDRPGGWTGQTRREQTGDCS